jgi:hypothetical protein
MNTKKLPSASIEPVYWAQTPALAENADPNNLAGALGSHALKKYKGLAVNIML